MVVHQLLYHYSSHPITNNVDHKCHRHAQLRQPVGVFWSSWLGCVRLLRGARASVIDACSLYSPPPITRACIPIPRLKSVSLHLQTTDSTDTQRCVWTQEERTGAAEDTQAQARPLARDGPSRPSADTAWEPPPSPASGLQGSETRLRVAMGLLVLIGSLTTKWPYRPPITFCTKCVQ